MWSNFVPSIPRYLSVNWLPVFGLHFGLTSSQKTLETVSFISFVPRRPTSFAGFAGRYLNVQDNVPPTPTFTYVLGQLQKSRFPPSGTPDLSSFPPYPLLCTGIHSSIHPVFLSFVRSFFQIIPQDMIWL